MIRKISRDEIIKSTLMFWMDDDIESKYEAKYESEKPKYTAMLSIGTRDGLKAFIRNNSESVKLLVTILGVSGEKFKRVITLLRITKGYVISSEWSESKVRSELCRNDEFMDEFCDLFFRQDVYREIIPRSILNDFQLDSERLIRVCSKDVLMKLIKTSYTTAYNSECAAAYSGKVLNGIKSYCDRYGLSFGKLKDTRVDPKDDIIAISNGCKYIVVTMNYTVTTSNNQTIYADKVQKIRSAIAGKDNYVLLNILDGAGWVARNADFNKVYNNCNHFLNLSNIDKIDAIIKETFNIR